MNEADDRLAGDPVWELFPYPAHEPGPGVNKSREYLPWLTVAGLIVVSYFVFPPLAVVIASVAVAARDFGSGRRLAQSIPDKAGGAVLARFRYAWGAWKLGMAAFVLMFMTLALVTALGRRREVPLEFGAAMFLWMGGFTASAGLTAWGLVTSYRSGMKIWVGEGVNRARMLMLGMLLFGFVLGVLLPMCFWLASSFPRASDSRPDGLSSLLGFVGCMFGGPLLILLVLDRVSHHVVADRPGKFGPKVPTVGKWNS